MHWKAQRNADLHIMNVVYRRGFEQCCDGSRFILKLTAAVALTISYVRFVNVSIDVTGGCQLLKRLLIISLFYFGGAQLD